MKTWFITGCSSGFGRRLALAATERGDRVVATARKVETIEEMAKPFGGRLITLPLDVTDAGTITTAVAKAVETFGGFDVLVNNAGPGRGVRRSNAGAASMIAWRYGFRDPASAATMRSAAGGNAEAKISSPPPPLASRQPSPRSMPMSNAWGMRSPEWFI